MIRTNISGGKYSNIFEYPNIRHTMIQGSCANELTLLHNLGWGINIFGPKYPQKISKIPLKLTLGLKKVLRLHWVQISWQFFMVFFVPQSQMINTVSLNTPNTPKQNMRFEAKYFLEPFIYVLL